MDSFLLHNCTLQILSESTISLCEPINCGNYDLNEFFSHDAIHYTNELLGKTYLFTLVQNPQKIVCAFTISNDSIKTFILPNSNKNKLNRPIPNAKRMKSYPAVLIGRLCVNTEFQDKNIGTELLIFIKAWFVDKGNKTGCRFIIVDSYNEQKPLQFYKRNGFKELFSSELEEKEYTCCDTNENLITRLLYFDLISLKETSCQ